MSTGRKVKWIVIGVPIAIVAVCGIGTGVGTVAARNKRDAELKLAIAAGLPASYNELWRPIDPKTDAGSALSKFNAVMDVARKTPEGKAWDMAKGPARLAATRRFLKAHPGVLQARDVVFGKTTLSHMSKPEDGFNILFPHYAEVKSVVKLTVDEAAVLAEDGRTDQAFDVLQKAAALAKVASQDKVLISELVAIANASILYRGAGKILASHSRDPRVVAKFGDFLDASRCEADSRVALRAEFGMMLAVDEQLRTGKLKPDELVAMMGEDESDQSFAMELMLKTPGFLDSQMASVFQSYRTLYSSVPEDKFAFAAREDAVTKHDRELETSKRLDTILARIFTPIYIGSFTAEAKAEATWRSLRAGLAAVEYRNRTGRYPEKLPVSGPLSMDPFSEQPLIYKRTNEGFLVYSVGENKKDDGGTFQKTGDSNDIDFGFGVPYKVH